MFVQCHFAPSAAVSAGVLAANPANVPPAAKRGRHRAYLDVIVRHEHPLVQQLLALLRRRFEGQSVALDHILDVHPDGFRSGGGRREQLLAYQDICLATVTKPHKAALAKHALVPARTVTAHR